MRFILGACALLAALYSGYWFVGSRAMLKGSEAALAQMKDEGRADYSAVTLHGFPSRFDETVTDPVLKSPDGLVVWRAPFFQVLALSYRPNQVIAVWPNEQTLSVGPQVYTLRSESLRASVTVTPGLSLPLEHAEAEGLGLDLSAGDDLGLVAEKMVLASRLPRDAQDGRTQDGRMHEIALVLTNPAPSPALKTMIDPGRRLPDHADLSDFNAVAAFDRPIDRGLIETPARLIGLSDIRMRLGWGEVRIEATGALKAGADGTAEGSIALSVQGWQVLYDLLRDAGLIPDDRAVMIKSMLKSLAKGTGSPDRLNVPLTFSDGMARLGPLPLFPAPRF